MTRPEGFERPSYAACRPMPWEAEQCECGKPGIHPYPIGGGWALACDLCKAVAVAAFEAARDDERFTPENAHQEAADAETWERWARDARGQS